MCVPYLNTERNYLRIKGETMKEIIDRYTMIENVKQLELEFYSKQEMKIKEKLRSDIRDATRNIFIYARE